jgi:hypothetical protein
MFQGSNTKSFCLMVELGLNINECLDDFLVSHHLLAKIQNCSSAPKIKNILYNIKPQSTINVSNKSHW